MSKTERPRKKTSATPAAKKPRARKAAAKKPRARRAKAKKPRAPKAAAKQPRVQKRKAKKSRAATTTPTTRAPRRLASAAAPAALARGAGGSAAGSPCGEGQRGAELLANVFVQPPQRLQSFFQVCASPAFLRVALFHDTPGAVGGTVLFEQHIGGQGQLNPVLLEIGPLLPGRYILQWGFAVVDNWEIAAEVWVDGVPRFRKLNAHHDTIPSNNVFAIVEVL